MIFFSCGLLIHYVIDNDWYSLDLEEESKRWKGIFDRIQTKHTEAYWYWGKIEKRNVWNINDDPSVIIIQKSRKDLKWWKEIFSLHKYLIPSFLPFDIVCYIHGWWLSFCVKWHLWMSIKFWGANLSFDELPKKARREKCTGNGYNMNHEFLHSILLHSKKIRRWKTWWER